EERFARLDIEGLVQRVTITNDRRGAAEELAVRWPQLSANEILEAPYVLIGTVDQIIEDLLARRERWRISSYTVQEALHGGARPRGRAAERPELTKRTFL
ncbi:MAG TPA: hypothetical protein VFQ90_08680, partial [Stellaceae bacterium]|nr:hypothetical protein [Stellaceae bacterium]